MVTYKQAGVDLEMGDKVSKIFFEASRKTWKNREGRIGGVEVAFEEFSALRYMDFSGLEDAAVMMNFDGVGTKVKIAQRVGDHSTIAFDLFAMLVDDASRDGYEPVAIGSILDASSLDVETAEQLASGMVAAAGRAGVAVVNGEVAELGDCVGGYGDHPYNWGGCVLGVARRERLMSGHDVREGDAIVAFREYGFRSNGISLVRRTLRDAYGEEWQDKEFGRSTLGRTALTPSRIYTPVLLDCTGGYSGEPKAEVHAIAHVTGGGIPGKLGRALKPSGLGARLDSLYEPCPLMQHVIELANIDEEESNRVFNKGNGMLVVTPEPAKVIEAALARGTEARVAGYVTERPEIEIV